MDARHPTNPTVDGAESFLRGAEERLLDLAIEAQQAEWVQATHITEDTTALANRSLARYLTQTIAEIRSAAPFRGLSLPPALDRRFEQLRTSTTLIPPADPGAASQLAGLVHEMEGRYARARVPLPGSEPLDLEELSRRLAEGRDPAGLRAVWVGWHDSARPLRAPFERYVELGNRGAREIGFADMGALWRARYDLPEEAVVREVHRLWEEMRPLYTALHAFVRRRLSERYGTRVVPPDGPLPAHLLGNMWGQSWEHLFDLLAPPGAAPGPDLTRILRDRGTTPRQMVEYGERFFTSLGLPPLPATFWTRSMLVRPPGREVVCHASAWDLDFVDDLRIKMCIDITEEDFRTIHHELGHNYYQRAYAALPFLEREGANDGFHEAIGDTISLSVTPAYLRKIGLFDDSTPPEPALPFLLRRALESVAFLPFGLLVDEWRWRVFDGTIPPEEYNRTWWEYRLRYQGIAPPEPRPDDAFDPGAKYHVPASVPYLRYFLAGILHYQFHRGLARAIGWKGPLHECSIYGEKAAGDRLGRALAMGASRPWPDVLEVLCGERTLDATAMLEYFEPLMRWLASENQGAPIGW